MLAGGDHLSDILPLCNETKIPPIKYHFDKIIKG